MVKITSIQGGIAAGKTTLCMSVEEQVMNCKAYLEPTAKENPWLPLFYQSIQSKNEAKIHDMSLKVQHWFLAIRSARFATIWMNHGNLDHVLLDRDSHSDVVFINNLYNRGEMSDHAYDYLMDTRKILLNGIPYADQYIHLDVSPEIQLDRILHMRKHDEEKNIQLDYLTGLYSCQIEFLNEMRERDIKVNTVDWNNFGTAAAIIDFIK